MIATWETPPPKGEANQSLILPTKSLHKAVVIVRGMFGGNVQVMNERLMWALVGLPNNRRILISKSTGEKNG